MVDLRTIGTSRAAVVGGIVVHLVVGCLCLYKGTEALATGDELGRLGVLFGVWALVIGLGCLVGNYVASRKGGQTAASSSTPPC